MNTLSKSQLEGILHVQKKHDKLQESQEVIPLWDTNSVVEFYKYEIENYKTASAKKAYLTRARKQCVEHLIDLRWASKHSGWLHGERVTVDNFIEANDEINAIDSIYQQL